MAHARPRTGPSIPPQRLAGEDAGDRPGDGEYRIDDLAREAGTTARNVRAYQDRGLLPRPHRRGRANVYGRIHLERLRLIAQLLDRGHTLAGIKELIDAWESGAGLGGVLGLAAEVAGPWSDETPVELTRGELTAAFGGQQHQAIVDEAVRLGVLELIEADVYRVPSPNLIRVAAELHALGAPLDAILEHLTALRADLDRVAHRFVAFSAEHIFTRCSGNPLSDDEAAEILSTVRRLRPLAQKAVDAELARSLRTEALHLLDAVMRHD